MTTATAPSILFRRAAELPFQKLADQTLVVNPRTREVHLLNLTAARIWDLLDRPRSADDLLATLLREFEPAGEEMRRDVEALLANFGSKGLLNTDAAASTASPSKKAR